MNNLTGLDAYNGRTQDVSSSLQGPKKTIWGAVQIAQDGDIISVASTGVPYRAGSDLEPASGIRIGDGKNTSRRLSFQSTGGVPKIEATFIVDMQRSIAAQNVVTFQSPFEFAGEFQLRSGVVRGASQLVLSGKIRRFAIPGADPAFDSSPTFRFPVDVIYEAIGEDEVIRSGFELPPSHTLFLRDLIIGVTGGFKVTVTLASDKHMSGALRVHGSSAFDLGSNTLHLLSVAQQDHGIDGRIFNGTLSCEMTNDVKEMANIVIRASASLPVVVASSSSAPQRLTIIGGRTLEGIKGKGSASIQLLGPVETIGDPWLTIDAIVNEGTGEISIVPSEKGLDVFGNVYASAERIQQAREGNILFSGGGLININGDVINEHRLVIPLSLVPSSIKVAGQILFPDELTYVWGDVLNASTFVYESGLYADSMMTVENSGMIRFASSSKNIIIGGSIHNAVRAFVDQVDLKPLALFKGNGNIVFLNSGGTVRVDGGITNSSKFPAFVKSPHKENGGILFPFISNNSIGSEMKPIGPIVNASEAFPGSGNGDIIIGDRTGIGGSGTGGKVFGTSITAQGTGGGKTVIENGPVILKGSVRNLRTGDSALQVIRLGNAGTDGSTILVAGDISSAGAGEIQLNTMTAPSLPASKESVTIQGALESLHPMGTIVFTNLPTSAGSSENLVRKIKAGNLWVEKGNIDFGGGGQQNECEAGDVRLMEGELKFGGDKTVLRAIGENVEIGKAMSFTGKDIALELKGKKAQRVVIESGTRDLPFSLSVQNASSATPAVRFVKSMMAIEGPLSFMSGFVELDSSVINIKAGGSGVSFMNASGYETKNDAKIILGGTLKQSVSGMGTFGNLEVDNAAGAVIDSTIGPFTQKLILTRGMLERGSFIKLENALNPPHIIRDQGSLVGKPTFVTPVDVTYIGRDKASATELPSSLRNLRIAVTSTNPVDSAIVTLTQGVTVTGNLMLESGVLRYDSLSQLQIAVGGKVNIASGRISGMSSTPSIASFGLYSLTYSGDQNLQTTEKEWPAKATIDKLTISVGSASSQNARFVRLHADRTVQSLEIRASNDSSGFHLGTTLAPKNLVVKGPITISTGRLSTVIAGAGTGRGTLFGEGDIVVEKGSLSSFGAGELGIDLVFQGTANQKVSFTSGQTVNSLMLNKSGKNPVSNITLKGGDLVVSGSMVFMNGVLTTGDRALHLPAPPAPFQGFDRLRVVGENVSHVEGTVRKLLKNTGIIQTSTNERMEFPVGGRQFYRPLVLTFKPTSGLPNFPDNTSFAVSHIDTKPNGTVGLPIRNGVDDGIDLGWYPPFYWTTTSSKDLGEKKFILEVTASGFFNYGEINQVRIIHRKGTNLDTTKTWFVNAKKANYDNVLISGIPTVIVVDSLRIFNPEGTMFTLGLKGMLFLSNPIVPSGDVLVLPDTARVFIRKLSSPPVFGGNVGVLTFTAVSSNPTIVAALITASDTLIIRGLRSGQASVSVTAFDVNGNQLSTTITVNVTGVTIAEPIAPVPSEFALMQNYPNPFNANTMIRFALPSSAPVTLEIYNVLGVKIRTLIAGVLMHSAIYQVKWDGRDDSGASMPSGMYLYRIVAGEFKASKKMMFLK